MPPLTIGNRTATLPIIQGGMAVRISMAPLAVAVAETGAIGVIAGSGLSVDEMRDEMRRARAATDGIIGVNVMVAIRAFKEVATAALDEGADMIIAGAGFSRDVFDWCRAAGAEMVPVVGSVKAAKLAERMGASAVVVESVEAGGHLGTDEVLATLLPPIVEAVDIPVIGAGNIVTGADIRDTMAMGAAGVQMGTRFAATVESSASDEFKACYVAATEDDVVLIQSPVGLPGRAVRTPLTDRLAAGDAPRIDKCISCLAKCGKEFCIIDKLVRAQEGDVVEGLVFAGSSVTRVNDVPTVADLVDRLCAEYEAAVAGQGVTS
jgi:NAD(P)H-dependent flavin oxidoreductase YrpB (nitropropane dioxygenase family)